MLNIKKTINDLFENYSLHLWEDTSDSYCALKYAETYSKNIIVFFDNAATKSELSFMKRYIGTFKNLTVSYFGVYFDQSGMIVFINTPINALIEIQESNAIILKYRGAAHSYIDTNQGKRIESIDKNAIEVVLPNYRERCEDMYLYYSENMDKLKYIIDHINDDASKATLLELIRVAAENDIYRLPEHHQAMKYFECFRHLPNEVWVNCGSCYGDTIFNYLSNGFIFSKIFAIEGSERFFGQMQRNMARLPEDVRRRIKTLNYFIGMENTERSFDQLFKHVPISFINMDIEGYEMPVLRGAQEVIRKCRPVISVCAYHLKSDLYDIPAFITEVAPDYSFFLRKYSSYEANAFNEFIYYCVPRERLPEGTDI